MTPAMKQAADALRPFARVAEAYTFPGTTWSDGKTVVVRLGGLRRAAEALRALEDAVGQPNPGPITAQELREWIANRPDRSGATLDDIDAALAQMPAAVQPESAEKVSQWPESHRKGFTEAAQVPEEWGTKPADPNLGVHAYPVDTQD
jgi:hypothetical protein